MLKILATLALSCSFPDPASASWQFALPVFVTVGTHVQQTAGTTARFDTLATFVELRLWSPCRSWSMSMFADYRITSHSRIADTLKKGLLFRHSSNDWDTLAAVFRSDPRGKPGAWGYAGRIRYRLAGNHKIGVESFGNHRRLDTAYLMLGYYGGLSPDLSVQFVAGSNVEDRRDKVARLEVVWQLN